MRRTLHHVLTAVLAGALVASVASAAGAESPTIPANRPTAGPGPVNGEVAGSLLVNVAPHCIAAREAGPSLARTFAMARQARIALGAEECYRPLADQVRYANQAQQPGANPACVASISRSPSGRPIGNSYHGWGKAVDLVEGGGSLRFGDAGYTFMKRVAASLGWNHPAFAEPGGSACPEPWHWEWVGDGGRLGLDRVRGDAVAMLPSAGDGGYLVVDGLGRIAARGSAVNRGDTGAIPIAWVVIGAASTADRGGYWLVGADGGVFTFGNARFHGSTGGIPLAQPVNGMAPSKTGRGYWLVAWDGGVFSFGDARFHGSTGGLPLVAPVTGMARTPSGDGYWLVASDGGVFSFGEARFFGSTGGLPLVSPIVAMAPTRSGRGYWLVASDGGVFSFGDAAFFGSLAGWGTAPVVAIQPTRDGRGYWLETADAKIFSFGSAHFFGHG